MCDGECLLDDRGCLGSGSLARCRVVVLGAEGDRKADQWAGSGMQEHRRQGVGVQ